MHVGFVLNACVHIVFLDFLVVIATRQSEGDYSVVCDDVRGLVSDYNTLLCQALSGVNTLTV